MPDTLNVLLVCPSYCMAPVLLLRCLLRLVLIYVVLFLLRFLLQIIFTPSEFERLDSRSIVT